MDAAAAQIADELELDLDHALACSSRNPATGRIRSGEENAVDRLADQELELKIASL